MLSNFRLNCLATSSSVLALTLSIAFVAQPAQKASAQVTSSYQKSCSNIKVEDGNLLSATCLKIDGSLNNTSLRIPGIENIDGELKFNNSNNPSSYQKSCSNIKVEDGNLLSATCLKIDGSLNNTSLRIPGIENINGVLSPQLFSYSGFQPDEVHPQRRGERSFAPTQCTSLNRKPL